MTTKEEIIAMKKDITTINGKIDNIDYFYELGERLKETHNVHQYFEPVTAKWRLVAKI